MKRQLTLQQYRTIDLFLFAGMLAIFEFVIVRFAFASFFTLSLAGAITAIVYMRWGWWGGIHAALAGFLTCLYTSLFVEGMTAEPGDYAIYIVGNLVSLLAVAALLRRGKEKVRQSVLASMAFGLAVILLMQGGRMAVALALGRPPDRVIEYMTHDPLSILFTVGVIWIVRRLDGVFEDQKHYLLRLQEERERNNTEQ